MSRKVHCLLLLMLLTSSGPTSNLADSSRPVIIPTPRDIQWDPRLLEIRDAIVATDGSAEMNQTANYLSRQLSLLLNRNVPVTVPKEDPGGDVTLFVIGDPARISWLSGIDQLWSLAPPEARRNAEGYFLVAAASHDRNYVICASRTSRGAFYAVQSLLQIIRPLSSRDNPSKGIGVPRVNIADWPAFRNRGIIEGFYGPPWTWEQRQSMVEFAASQKMNWFILAPKDAPWHRSHWQEPHTLEELSAINQINRIAQEHFVNFCYAISPGRTMTLSHPTDLNLLLSKVESVQRLGVRAFALLMDDIPAALENPADRGRFKTLEDAHLYVAIQLYRAIKSRDSGARLFFCPTKYYGDRPYESSYVKALGARLPSDIFIFWTGPGIVSMSLTESTSDVVAATLQRQPFFWDNFPVNDYDRTRLFLGPIAQRSPGLPDHCSGLVSNPMNEPEASKLPLTTIADYLWNPIAYSPQRSWDVAVSRLSDPDLQPSLRAIVQLSAPNRFWAYDGVDLDRRINRLWSAWKSGDGQGDIHGLHETLEQLRSHCLNLASHPLPSGLTGDLRGLIKQTYELASLGNDAIDVLQLALDGSPDFAARAERLKRDLDTIDADQTREGIVSCPALDTLREFISQCAELPLRSNTNGRNAQFSRTGRNVP